MDVALCAPDVKVVPVNVGYFFTCGLENYMLMSAKKKSRDNKKEKSARKEAINLQGLKADIASLEDAIAELKVFAEQSFKISETLAVDGSTKLLQAKKLVRKYAANLWRAARNAQDQIDSN